MKILILLLSFVCFLVQAKEIKLDESKWKKRIDEDGVKIYGQTIKGSNLIAFKTVYTVKAPVDKMLAVLRDAEGSIRWAKNLKSATYIEEPSDLEATIYEIRQFPWPLKERDLIVQYKLGMNKEKKNIEVFFNSIKHAKYPKNKDKVRADLIYGLMAFWPQKNKTKIELTILAHPRGAIPNWVVNLFSESQPFEYIKALEKEANSSKIAIRPGLKEVLDQYFTLFPETKP